MRQITTMQLFLAMAMTTGLAASAQQTTMSSLTSVAGVELQAAVVMNVAQVKDELFAGSEKFAQGASEVTEINLDPSTMGLVGRTYGPGGDETRKMKSMVIHTYKYDKPGMYRMEDVDAYRKKLEDGSWHCAIKVRTTTGSTDICSRTAADNETNEMVILTAEPQKLTFIHMSGKMSLDELNGMSGTASRFRPQTELPRTQVFVMPKVAKDPKDKTKGPEPPVPPQMPQ